MSNHNFISNGNVKRKVMENLEQQVKDANIVLKSSDVPLLGDASSSRYSVVTKIKNPAIFNVHPAATYASELSFDDAKTQATVGYKNNAFKVLEFNAVQTYSVDKKQKKALAGGAKKRSKPGADLNLLYDTPKRTIF